MDNAIEYPEAWKIFVNCVRKWPNDDSTEVNWKYVIPNPENKTGYLYSDWPAKLFDKFRKSFYKTPEEKIKEFRNFLIWLEYQEGKRF
ncbi:MAG: hypothetical protein ABI550_07745 [Ignavibacteriaceae bacterium]